MKNLDDNGCILIKKKEYENMLAAIKRLQEELDAKTIRLEIKQYRDDCNYSFNSAFENINLSFGIRQQLRRILDNLNKNISKRYIFELDALRKVDDNLKYRLKSEVDLAVMKERDMLIGKFKRLSLFDRIWFNRNCLYK